MCSLHSQGVLHWEIQLFSSWGQSCQQVQYLCLILSNITHNSLNFLCGHHWFLFQCSTGTFKGCLWTTVAQAPYFDGLSQVNTGLFFSSIVYIISAPASPVLGFLVDKTGKNVAWVMAAVVTTLAAHIMLAFTFWDPWIAMVLFGKLHFFTLGWLWILN